MKNKLTDTQKDKQKANTSKTSIFTFIGSSIYLHYDTNWENLIQPNSIVYFLLGILGSGVLLGMFHYYLAKLITLLLMKTIKNPTEKIIKFYTKLTLVLGVVFFFFGIVLDFYLTRLYFNNWYLNN